MPDPQVEHHELETGRLSEVAHVVAELLEKHGATCEVEVYDGVLQVYDGMVLVAVVAWPV